MSNDNDPGWGGPVTSPALETNRVTNNLTILRTTNPYIDNSPELLEAATSLAGMTNYTPDQLARHGGTMLGVTSTAALRDALEDLTPAAQRAAYSRLSTQTQAALGSLGFTPESGNNESWIDRNVKAHLGPVGDIVGGVLETGLSVGGDIASVTLGPTLDALTWVGDQTAHLYRSIRAMDGEAQLAALAAGIAAVAAAPFTGGGSLAAYGTLTAGFLVGTTALVGGVAGANLYSVATGNPTDWWDSYNSTWDGERVFTRDAQRAARDLLSNDTQLVNLAKDYAWYDGDFYDLATELAGTRSPSEDQMFATLSGIVADMAEPGSVEYQALMSQLGTLVATPQMQNAIEVLRQGKISPGRDFARLVGLDPGSNLYNVTSGFVDGAWAVVMDPTLVVGVASKAARAARYGVNTAGDHLGVQVAKLIDQEPAVARAFDVVAEAVETRNFDLIRRKVPSATQLYNGLVDHADSLGNRTVPYSRDDIVAWFDDSNNVTQLLAGKGLRTGRTSFQVPRLYDQAWQDARATMAARMDKARGLDSPAARLREMRRAATDAAQSSVYSSFRNFRDEMLGLTEALDDARLVRIRQRIAKRHGLDYDELLDTHIRRTNPYFNGLSPTPVTNRGYQLGQWLTETIGVRTVLGRPLSTVAGAVEGSVLMLAPGRSVAFFGDDAAADLAKMIDQSRVLGYTSQERAAWRQVFSMAPNAAVRNELSASFLNDVLETSGVRYLPGGQEIADQFLHRWKNMYSANGVDEIIIDGQTIRRGVLPRNHQAVRVLMPDLKIMRRAVRRSAFLHNIVGLSDTAFVDGFMNRVWKPSVLLRMGFVTRAAGEEMLAFAARGPEGFMQELAARSIARGERATMARGVLGDAQVRAGQVAAAAGDRAVPQVAEFDRVVRDATEGRLFGFRHAGKWAASHDWTRPVDRLLRQYTDIYRQRLTTGFLRGAGEQWDAAVDRTIRDYAAEGPFWDRVFDRKRVAANWADTADALLWGRDTSVRRMLRSGVEPHLLGAARSFETAFLGSQLSTLMATDGHWLTGSADQTDAVRTVLTDDGKLIELQVRMGEREAVARIDDAGRHQAAVFQQSNEPFTDEVVRPALLDAYGAYLPPELAQWESSVRYREDFADLTAVLDETLEASQGRVTRTYQTATPLQVTRQGKAVRRYDGVLEGLEQPIDRVVYDLLSAGLADRDQREAIEAALDWMIHSPDWADAHTELTDWLEVVGWNVKDLTLAPSGRMGARAEALITRFQEWRGVLGPIDAVASSPAIRRWYAQAAKQNLLGRPLGGYRKWDDAVGDVVPTNLYIRDHDEFVTLLQSRLREQLLLPDNADVRQRMVSAIRSRDGRPVAAPVPDNTTRVYTPVLTPAQADRLIDKLWLLRDDPANAMDVLDALVGEGFARKAAEKYPELADSLDLAFSEELISNLMRRLLADPEQVRALVRTAQQSNAAGVPLVHLGVEDPRTAQAFIDHVVDAFGLGDTATIGRVDLRTQTVKSRRAADADLWNEVYTVAPPAGGEPSWQAVQSVIARQKQPMSVQPVGGGGQSLYWLHPDAFVPQVEVLPPGLSFVEVFDMTGASKGVVPGLSETEVIDDLVALQVSHLMSVHTSQKRAFRVRETERNGQRITEVYRIDNKGVIRPAEQALYNVDDGRFVLADGKPISLNDSRYFDVVDETTAKEPQLLWPLIAPQMMDAVDDLHGIERVIPLNTIRRFEGQEFADVTHKQVRHASLADVDAVQGDMLPDFALAPVLVAPKQLNFWDRAVRWGFGRVISPWIDRLARTPMALHYYTAAWNGAREQSLWLVKGDVQDAFARAVTDTGPHGMLWFDEDAASRWDTLVASKYPPGQAPAPSYDPAFASEFVQQVNRLRIGRKLPPLTDAMDAAIYVRSLGSTPYMIRQQIGGHVRSARMWADDADTAAVEAAAAWLDSQPLEQLSVAINSRNAVLTKYDEYHTALTELYDERSPLLGFDQQALRDDHPMVRHVDGTLRPETWADLPANILDNALSRMGLLPGGNTRTVGKELKAYAQELGKIEDVIQPIAVQKTISDMLPYLDSPEIRSQFAEWGKGLMPFWYAEENFVKRWGRTLALDGPLPALATIRKGQLMYAGMKSGGVIRTDEQGIDYVVVPGSGLLVEALERLTPLPTMQTGTVFQMRTDRMLPGFSDQIGRPGVAPMVALPLDLMSGLFPELKPIERAIVGDIGINRNLVEQFLPASLSRLYVASVGNESNQRYASAMLSTIAMLEAQGKGLPKNATTLELQNFLDRVRAHTRGVLYAQTIVGFISPGAPTALATGDESLTTTMAALGVDDPGGMFADHYYDYIREYGLEDGTARMMAEIDAGDFSDWANPLAFMEGKTESVSGARIPYSMEGLQPYLENKDWFDQYPTATAWLLPDDPRARTADDFYASSQALANGLRRARTPDEFLRAIKFREGALRYFDGQETYEAALAVASPEQRRQLSTEWDRWSQAHLAANPIFAEELAGKEASIRRTNTLRDLRIVLYDTEAPALDKIAPMRQFLESYDTYLAYYHTYKDDRSAQTQAQMRTLKESWEAWATGFTVENPSLRAFWQTVLRPESHL